MQKLALLLLASPLWAQFDLGRVIPAAKPLHIAAFGDYGSGEPGQKEVAHALQVRNRQEPFTFGITMGDNFYRCGVKNVNDPLWQSRWEDLYTPLGVLFYTALGNHDYGHPPIICPAQRSSPDAEVAYTNRSKSWRMPARYYTYAAGPARFLVIDTEGWTDTQFKWVKETLAKTRNEPGVKWRIVYGHHPMYTSGMHLNQRRIAVLREELAPVFKSEKVDLYIAGHDHDMERLSVDGIDYLIAGSGGADLRNVKSKGKESLFAVKSYGFLDLEVNDAYISAKFLDPNLRSLEKKTLLREK